MVELHPIEQLVIAALERKEQLSLADLGGLDKVVMEWESVSSSKILDEILKVLTSSLAETKENDQSLCRLFQQGLATNGDAITVREVVRLICNHPERLAGTFNYLLTLAGDQQRPAILRRYYLLAAFEISLKSPSKKYAIIAFLLEIDDNDSPDFLSHAIKLLGIGYTLFSQEELFTKLELLEDKCEEEGTYEIGMSWLHKALNSEDRVEVKERLSKAKTYFSQALTFGRTDAKVYVAILGVLDQLENGRDKQAISNLLPELHLTILAHNAWQKPDPDISWNQMRMTEGFHWLQLYEKLTQLASELDTPAWYNPALIIEDYLLQVYASNRTIFRRKDGQGLDHILRPMVRKSLANQPDGKIYLLEQWLRQRRDHIHWDIADDLQRDIVAYQNSKLPGNESGAVAEDLAVTVPSFAKLPIAEQQDFELFITRYKESRISGASYLVEQTFNDCSQSLSAIADFQQDQIRYDFQSILYPSLLFLENRMNATRENHPEAAYLFANYNNPVEADLQLDYYKYMSSMPREGNVSIETSNISSGRVDVYFRFLKYFFCTEVKREERDCSFDALASKFLGQAMEYSNTSAKLGILLVLDLTAKADGMASFQSNVKVEIRDKVNDQTLRGIVVIRVPGNRIVPSKVRLAES